MSPTRINRSKTVKAIFVEVIEVPPSERTALLDVACAGDAKLRAAVERLLHRAAEDGEVSVSGVWRAGAMEPVKAGPERPPGAGLLGTMVGPYRVLEQIGEGGFGAVFIAEQVHPVQRRVALKIIRAGMDSASVIARFEVERQALAMMDHPGIARVLDAGATPNGSPYFAMELVRGVPITDYCRSNALRTAERLELFASLCGAVQHAHQKGVIHRDLKPSNVLVALVDGRPVAKVIDFGIAKAIAGPVGERTRLTEQRTLIGTPEYMSPEQANLDGSHVDTRSDVYSLGVLLYELLTGATPHDRARLCSAPLSEMQRIIRDEEPPRPSLRERRTLGAAAKDAPAPAGRTGLRRAGRLGNELDWITMRALEKEPSHRYESASALGADVRRYLADEPIAAGPPGTWYRLRKLSSRHRRLVISSGVVVAVILAGLVASTIGFISARRERDAKIEALGAAESSAVRAQRLAYRLSLAAAVAAIEAGDSRGARSALEDAPTALRGWEWRHLDWRSDSSAERVDLRALTPQSAIGALQARAPVFLDERRVIAGGGGAGVVLCDLETGERTTLCARAVDRVAAWQPPREGETGLLALLSPDGELTCARIWTSEPLWMVADIADISPQAFSLDGESIAALHADRVTQMLIDARTGVKKAEWKAGNPAASGALFLPSGIAVWRVDGRISWEVLDPSSWTPTERLISPVPLHYCIGGGRYALASHRGVALITLAGTSRSVLRATPTGRAAIACTEISADGKTAVTVDESGTHVIWDVDRGEPARVLLGAEAGSLAAISPGGKWMASAGPAGLLRVWPAGAGAGVPSVVYEGPDERSCVAFSPDGRLEVAGGWGFVEAWDAQTGARLWSRFLSRHVISAIAVSADGARVVCATLGASFAGGRVDRAALFVLDAATGEVIARRESIGFLINGIGSDTRGWVAACRDGHVRLLDPQTAEVTRDVTVSGQALRVAAIAPGAGMAITIAGTWSDVPVSGPLPGEPLARMWQTADFAPVHEFPAEKTRAVAAAIDQSGSAAAVLTADGTVVGLDLIGKRVLWRVPIAPHPTAAVAFHPDGSRVAVGTPDGLVWIIDTKEAEVVAVLPGPRATGDWRFTPDGASLLASGQGVALAAFETGRPAGSPLQGARLAAARERERRAAEIMVAVLDTERPVADVQAKIAARAELLPHERDAAHRRAALRGNKLNSLNNVSVAAVLDPTLSVERYRETARVMEGVCRDWPADPAFLNTLATAYYRAGELDKAAAMLERCTAMRAQAGQPAHPVDTLVLAATRAKQGRTQEARRILQEARAAVAAQGLESDDETRAWRREAESIIKP